MLLWGAVLDPCQPEGTSARLEPLEDGTFGDNGPTVGEMLLKHKEGTSAFVEAFPEPLNKGTFGTFDK